MDFIEIERGYASFYRGLLKILRNRDVDAFLRHIANHPREAGRFSHCLGLSRELAEIEMHKTILRFENLKDLHQIAREFLKGKGVKIGREGKRERGRKRNKNT